MSAVAEYINKRLKDKGSPFAKLNSRQSDILHISEAFSIDNGEWTFNLGVYDEELVDTVIEACSELLDEFTPSSEA